MSFRQSPWYLSGIFILVVVILTLIFIIGVKDVSSFITTLPLFSIKLPVFYNGEYNGLLIALGIKSGVGSLGGYNFNTYSLPVWLIVASLLY